MTYWRTSQSLVVSAAVVAATLAVAPASAAQSPPSPQGTMALEGTMTKVYRAAHVVIVTTIDGVEHAYRFTRDLVVHGGKGSGVAALAGLHKGSAVVVHYSVQGSEPAAREIDVIGADGLETTEGIVTRVDRRAREITVRYDSGKTETFRLTDAATTETGQTLDETTASGTKVVIYFSNERGEKVAHFFRIVSK